MGQRIDLLRLLEPTVRPGNVPGVVRGPVAPFEFRSFESLLEEAQRQPAESASGDVQAGQSALIGSTAPPQQSMLQRLAGPGAVQNAALRDLLAR
jgi:hypothetical protein